MQIQEHLYPVVPIVTLPCKYAKICRRSDLREALNRDNLMQGLMFSAEELNCLPDHFTNNEKVLRKFGMNEDELSDSIEIDDEAVFLEELSPRRLFK